MVVLFFLFARNVALAFSGLFFFDLYIKRRNFYDSVRVVVVIKSCCSGKRRKKACCSVVIYCGFY